MGCELVKRVGLDCEQKNHLLTTNGVIPNGKMRRDLFSRAQPEMSPGVQDTVVQS